MNHNQIVISLSCSDLEKKDIVKNINLFLSGELKGNKVSFVELDENKTIKLNDWFIYAILMIRVEPVSNAIMNAIKDKELVLKFIDIDSKNELYSWEFDNHNLIDEFSNLTKKEIAESIAEKIKEKILDKNLKQQLSEMFTKKMWVRTFTRNKFNELDKKIDSLHQSKDFSIGDVKNLLSFLYPISETLKDNKKAIIREHIRRLIYVEKAINKEIPTDILDTLISGSTPKKKKKGFSSLVSKLVVRQVAGVAFGAIGLGSVIGEDLFLDIGDDEGEIG